MVKKYETMLVTSAKLDEEQTAALVGKFTALIEANGTLEGVDEWGKRKLAYPINKEEDGVYTLIHFSSGIEFPAELDRVYKITDGVIRSLIIAKTEAQEAAAAKAAAKDAAAKEAAAKAAAAKAADEAKAAAAKAEEATAEQEANV